MYNEIGIDKNTSNTSIIYNRGYYTGCDKDIWESELNKTINDVIQKENSKEFSKDDLSNVFAENSNNYVMDNIAKYITNLKDLDGNSVDFNSLSSDQQYYILFFINKPLENVLNYGTQAYLSDIKINTNENDFYIEANIHTIDGQVFSAASKFSKMQVDIPKYDYGIFVENANPNQVHEFSFVSPKNLSTDERREMLEKIKNSDLKDLKDFEGNVEIKLISDNVTGGGFMELNLFETYNLKLDYEKAIVNAKSLLKDENSSNKKSDEFSNSLLVLFWNNIRINLEKFKDFNLTKINQENVFIKQKNEDELLKSLLKNI
ncbi:hypothetical protein [Campylobacter aviculae]|uniref:Uncharacterized protein n=1 Tax=Campylobacter aviculae TaxID=2510190 RepID=A0A4V6DW61_9BACT|nr:hypothetical protein [Campylobacter aviculae]TKX30632.1 hypothetical protein CQA76_07785 [Campylobacter aviculae]